VKLPAFDYAAPQTLAEAIALLATHADALPISGGQSLIPILAFRLAAPSLLVDLRCIPGLDTITVSATGVSLGAKVRWCDIEQDERLASAHPLLAEAVNYIAHYPIRSRGTVGGSLAHADTAAELPGIAVTCDAEIVAIGSAGTRAIAAQDFFVGPMMTSLAHDELVTELRLPPWPPARRWAFEEFARQHGAFALAGIALYYDLQGGVAANTHIGVIGASSKLQRIAEAEAALNGRVVDEAAILETAKAAAAAVDPADDIDAPAAYRRSLVETLTERALQRARGR
jgi:aerobic carbon-monoxide dehydrogenase medium subunit